MNQLSNESAHIAPEKCNTNFCEECSKKHTPTVPRLHTLFLGVTEDCNMRCRYCFVHHNPARMTIDTATKALYFLIAQQDPQSKRNLNITFFGGEPTLEWDSIIVPIVKRGKELTNNGMTFNITSNGVLLDRDKLEFMKNNNMSLLFSFDGDEETQNYNRPMKGGQPSFPLLRDKVKLILEYFPQMTFRATIYTPTVHLMAHNFRYALSEGYKNFFLHLTHTEVLKIGQRMSLQHMKNNYT